MGKLKEKLLNNINENEMDDQFELSAFEYVELVERYKIPQKEDEYVPTDDELEKLEQMVKDYYNSKEFREYVENYTPTDEYVNSLTDAELDEAIAEHNQHEDSLGEDMNELNKQFFGEWDEINNSLKVKFTEDEVIQAVRAIKNEDWFVNGIRKELNRIWNNKNGVF
jgi:predicted DNA binding CopG/RHH family protein